MHSAPLQAEGFLNRRFDPHTRANTLRCSWQGRRLPRSTVSFTTVLHSLSFGSARYQNPRYRDPVRYFFSHGTFDYTDEYENDPFKLARILKELWRSETPPEGTIEPWQNAESIAAGALGMSEALEVMPSYPELIVVDDVIKNKMIPLNFIQTNS